MKRLYLIFFSILSLLILIGCQKTKFLNEAEITDCYIEKEIIIKNLKNKTNQESISKITCTDGPKSIITKTGLAENCQYFYWDMPVGGRLSKQRGIVCKKLDGTNEIISEMRSGM